jgi:hypothetical protein
MGKKKRALKIGEPIIHDDHKIRSRRDFIRHGLITGPGLIVGGGVFSLFANPREVMSQVSGDLQNLADSFSQVSCQIGGLTGDTKVPFIAFDLGGGAGISSNVLVGKQGGQLDLMDTAGYVKMGIPGNMLPGQVDAAPVLAGTNGDFTDTSLGLVFHSDAGFLRGIDARAPTLRNSGFVDGTVIAARSDNDTGNNPHNPMYGIAMAGAQGGVTTLIGSVSSVSGARSMSPASLINPELQPTKVDRPTDVTGMVDVGDLTTILNAEDVTAVMEAVARISHKKMRQGDIQTGVSRDAVIKELVSCGYLRAADLTDRFANIEVDPGQDPNIVGPGGIFSQTEWDNNREYRKTGSVMKMVIDGHAGAGSITMGGYDYHTGERGTGERRDFLAGECIGAVLDYARRSNNGNGTPVMIYVYSDGSVSSNGRIDTTAEGRDKPEWTGDNSSTACSFILVYNPTGVPLYPNGLSADLHRQIGWFTSGGSVVTTSSSAANNVNALAHTAILNFMALNGDVTPGNYGAFTSLFTNSNGVPTHGISNFDRMIAFGDITP